MVSMKENMIIIFRSFYKGTLKCHVLRDVLHSHSTVFQQSLGASQETFGPFASWDELVYIISEPETCNYSNYIHTESSS